MGLSTASVRMLFLTAQEYQKNDEIRSLTGKKRLLLMQSEDAARVAKAIRNTKHLVFQGVNGEGTKDENLTYNALMGTGAYNQGETDRYFVTNVNNNLVLDTKTAGAARAAGIESGKKGSVNSTNFEKFMNEMVGKPQNSSDTWYNLATKTNDSSSSYTGKGSVNTLLSYLSSGTTHKDTTYTTAAHLKNDGADFNNWFAASCNNSDSTFKTSCNSDGSIGGWFGTGTLNSGKADDAEHLSKLVGIEQGSRSLKDLFDSAGTTKGTMILGMQNYDKNNQNLPDNIKNAMYSFGDSVGSALSMALTKMGFGGEKFNTLLSNTCKEIAGSYINNYVAGGASGNGDAVTKLLQQNKKDGTNNSKLNDADPDHNEDAMAAAMLAAAQLSRDNMIVGRHGIVSASSGDEGWNGAYGSLNGRVYAIDAGQYVKDVICTLLSQITEGSVYTTKKSDTYDKAIDGYDTSIVAVDSEFKIKPEYTPAGASASSTSSASTIPDAYTAKFYYDLFKQICEKGYAEDADVGNTSKFQEKLKNGTYQIISNTKDNYGTRERIDNTELGIYEEVIGGDKYDQEADDYLNIEKARIHREENDIDEQLTVKQAELQAIRNWKESERSQVMQRAQTDFQLFVTA